MQYKTNQLDETVLFSNENYQNIAQDFWVYKFSIDAKKVGYQYSLIDEIKQQLQGVKSVVYLASKAFYALFEKSKFKNEFELEDQIKKLITNSDEVQADLVTNLRDKNEIDKRHLTQLLFNSLANTSSENTRCSNITGGLYWVVRAINSKPKDVDSKQSKEIIWQYIALKLELDYHLHLKLEVKTFSNLLMTNKMNFDKRKTKLKDYVQYEIKNDTNSVSDFVRHMKRLETSERVIFRNEVGQEKISEQQRKKEREKAAQTYIIAQADNKKNTVSFLDFSNRNSFETSKSGVLYLFLKDVKEQLTNYITIKFVELPFNEEKIEFDKKLSDSVKAKVKAFYQSKPIIINIADSLKDDQEANKLAKDLQIFLTDQECDYKVQHVSIGDLSEKALNIRIIHNKKHYEDERITDEYSKDEKYLIHHITTDDFDIELERTKKSETQKLLSSPAIDVILKESYIKNDIRQGKISILDWTFGEWLFMGKEEFEEENQNTNDRKYSFHLLRVLENGNLEFTKCLPDQVFSNLDYEKLKSIYQTYDKFNGREFLNCLLVSNHQDINLIFETPRFTIQEIEKIGETLKLEDKDGDKFLNQTKMIKLIQDFSQSSLYKEKDKESLGKLVSILEKHKLDFSKKKFLDWLGKEKANLSNKGENHLQGRFCKFYQQQTGDVLKSFFRGKAEKEELLSSRLDIFYQTNETQTEAFYFVGESSNNPNNPLNSSFQNATNIRKIKAVRNLKGQQSKLVFDQLLQTMAVDFVKQGNLTVLPFPFKYLREIQK